jgi:DNA-binding response OmpR family regulator
MKEKILTEETVEVDSVTLDLENNRFVTPYKTRRLRPMECRLLQVLMQRPNRVVSRASLMQEVWETDFLDDTRTLDVHICMLRRKIEPNPQDPKYLRTVRGVGYIFCA